MEIERLPNESYPEYAQRLTEMVGDGDINWQEWSDNLLGENVYNGDSARKNGQFFRRYIYKNSLEKCVKLSQKSYEKCDSSSKNDAGSLALERKKIQDANRELQATYREQARRELFDERILNAIDRLPKIEVNCGLCDTNVCDQTGVLVISDIHAGANYEIKGLHGEIINEYNENVLCRRMEQILAEVQMDKDDYFKYNKLVIACCGDIVEGCLRDASLVKLKEPVLDTLLKFSEYYANWLVSLYEIVRVPIEAVIAGGNHDILRFLSSKPQFPQENFAKVFREYVYLRLKDISDITVRDYATLDVVSVCGQNLAFSHGNEKDLKTAMEFYQNIYKVDIDTLYVGHLHSSCVVPVGVTSIGDKECIRVGSICGVDDYAMKLNKASSPSCYFALYNNNGRRMERKIILK